MYLVRRWCIPAFEGGFGTQYARAIRKKRCGSSCVDRIVAIVHASIAAVRIDLVDVDFRVLGELVELELDRYGGTSDRTGQADACGDG